MDGSARLLEPRKVIRAIPLRRTLSSQIIWKLGDVNGKLSIGEIVRIEETSHARTTAEEPPALEWRLLEIHEFWGRYAIVSMGTEDPQDPENHVPTQKMYWIDSPSLDIPSDQQGAAHRACLLQPYAILNVM